MTLILKVGLTVPRHHHLVLKVTEELCDEQEFTGSSESNNPVLSPTPVPAH